MVVPLGIEPRDNPNKSGFRKSYSSIFLFFKKKQPSRCWFKTTGLPSLLPFYVYDPLDLDLERRKKSGEVVFNLLPCNYE
jgi:hypothetical protein